MKTKAEYFSMINEIIENQERLERDCKLNYKKMQRQLVDEIENYLDKKDIQSACSLLDVLRKTF